VRVPFVVEQLLPLLDHPQVVIVQDDDLDWEFILYCGRELMRGHLEAAIAINADDHPVGECHLGTDSRR
jgi:hypothetical protein